jgi:hypothetical protein
MSVIQNDGDTEDTEHTEEKISVYSVPPWFSESTKFSRRRPRLPLLLSAAPASPPDTAIR